MILITPLPKYELDEIKRRGLYDTNEINKVANALILSRSFDGMTNGDVIKTLFPNAKIQKDILGNFWITSPYQLGTITFREVWWNAPYKED